tara:strand:- start:225 stop:491 length:267 start_codon:yes stop_codon:yes gene_type:complete
LEKEPEADRAFAKLAPKFVILHFDTRNGRAPHVERLKVKRNQIYALVLRPNGTEIDRIEKPSELKPMVTLMKKALKEKRLLDENPTRL